MGLKSRFASAALEYAYAKFIGDDKKQAAAFDEEVANAEIGRRIYDLRMGAGLTQGELAKRVGTTSSVISRLEDADDQGHSLGMLRRVAKALHQRVEIRFLPIQDATPRVSSSFRRTMLATFASRRTCSWSSYLTPPNF
jgi:transcriptional regulator with XRE-family HTH domain